MADSRKRKGVPSSAPMGRSDGSLYLPPRLRQVLALMAEGRTQKEIAYELGLSPHTVRAYIEKIYERLGAVDRVQAVSTALRAGLID